MHMQQVVKHLMFFLYLGFPTTPRLKRHGTAPHKQGIHIVYPTPQNNKDATGQR